MIVPLNPRALSAIIDDSKLFVDIRVQSQAIAAAHAAVAALSAHPVIRES